MKDISRLNRIPAAFHFVWMAALLAVICLLVIRNNGAQAQAVVVPDNPTGLTAATVAHNSITLSWNDPGDSTISGYVILRRDPETQDAGTFSTIQSDTGSDATTYTDTTVDPETRYVCRVKATNSVGTSGRSNFVNVTTPAAPVVQPTATATAVPRSRRSYPPCPPACRRHPYPITQSFSSGTIHRTTP